MTGTSTLYHGLCAGAVIGMAFAAAPAHAQPTNIAVALPTTSLTFAAHYLAEDMGYFEEEGLRVDTSVVTGIGATNAVLAGSVQFSNGSGVTIVRATARNQPLVAIGVAINKPPLEGVISKSEAERLGITPDLSIEERAKRMRGLRLGSVGVNTIPHGYLRYFLRKGELDPERDVVYTPMAPAALIAALSGGEISGFFMSQPWTVIPVHEGTAITLVSSPQGDLAELEPTNYNVVIARRDYCPDNPDVCRGLLSAYQKAMSFIRDNTSEAREVLAKRFADMDSEVFAQAFDVIRGATPDTPRVTAEGFANDQNFMLVTGMMREDETLTSFDAVFSNDYQP